MFDQYSKWIVFADYNFDGDYYMIFVRKNLKTGMLKFKTKKINKQFTCFHPKPLINMAEQFEKILSV